MNNVKAHAQDMPITTKLLDGPILYLRKTPQYSVHRSLLLTYGPLSDCSARATAL